MSKCLNVKDRSNMCTVVQCDPYSTADYCDTQDTASMRHEEWVGCTSANNCQKYNYCAPSTSRCLKKHYKFPPNACFHKPRSTLSFPSRRFQKTKRRGRRNEETTSMDDKKSVTSYSSALTVDVSHELAGVSRDIDEIIRKYRDFHCENQADLCIGCMCHRRKGKLDRLGLSKEQLRILSVKRPVVNKLKEIPPYLLNKTRSSRCPARDKAVPSHFVKYKTSRDIREMVEEADAVLRNICKDMPRKAKQRNGLRTAEEDGYHCDSGVAETRAAACFEMYLGCPNKCRRIHDYRCPNSRWKDLFERGENMFKEIKHDEDNFKHVHDTNCISEMTHSKYDLKKESRQVESIRKEVKDAGVNTEEMRLNLMEPSDQMIDQSGLYSRKTHQGRTYPDPDQRLTVDLQPLKVFATYTPESSLKQSFGNQSQDSKLKSTYTNYTPESSAIQSPVFKNSDYEHVRSSVEDRSDRPCRNDEDRSSLILDRNMGISLQKDSKCRLSDQRKDKYCDVHLERPVIPLPDATPLNTKTNQDNAVWAGSKSGAGDSSALLESSKMFVSYIINKIINRSVEWTPANASAVDCQHYKKQEMNRGSLDAAICLEIINRLVDLLLQNDEQRMNNIGETSSQYSRIRLMNQKYLKNIQHDVKNILDLQFYLENASASPT